MDIRPIGNALQAATSPVEKIVTTAQSSSTNKSVTAPASTPVVPPPPAPTLAEVTQAVNSINQAMQAMSRDLEFSIDADTKQTVVKIVDQKTKEVLRQIPTAEALAIAKSLDQARGLLIKQKA